MQLKFLVAVLAALPLCGQAQPNNAPKASNAEAQKVVKLISSDQAKTKAYCEMSKLSDQAQQAEQKKDAKKLDELSKKMDELGHQLGPEFGALMDGLDSIDPKSKAAEEINATLENLDKLCAK
jgi:ABC-type transporter Mla subunit MlaD